MDEHTLSTSGAEPDCACCIAGGGPAGIMLAALLARAGISVTVLEKHADFLRDFRGDTVHPSTMQILDELGLKEAFAELPQRRVQQLSVRVSGRMQPVVDFRGLEPFDYLALVPQWDFLNLLAGHARAYPGFDLLMRHEVIGLLEERGRVAGVRVRGPHGECAVRAQVVVACDGRDSRLREQAGLEVRDLGAPMDVLWFRFPRDRADPEEIFASVGAGEMLVMLNRGDYWQAAYVVPKGGQREARAGPVENLRRAVERLAPALEGHGGAPTSWEEVETLEVRVNRLRRWHRPGLLVIGDAAHAMSPIGGVGINLAIQDAVAAANALTPVLRVGRCVDEKTLRGVQRRRSLPTRLTQSLQLAVQKRLISKVLASTDAPPSLPAVLRGLLRFRAVRRIPARLIGYGIRRERVSE